MLQTETRDEITVVDGADRTSPLRKDRIKSMKSSPISFMPEGLIATLPARQVKDLMTFLLTSPLEPAPLEINGAPAPRKEAALKELLQQAAKTIEMPPSAPFNIVLCAGAKDHGPSEHDYPLWQKRWGALLALKAGAHVARREPSEEQWRTANVVILFEQSGWNQERARGWQPILIERGRLRPFAIDGHDKVESLAQIIGALADGVSKFAMVARP